MLGTHPVAVELDQMRGTHLRQTDLINNLVVIVMRHGTNWDKLGGMWASRLKVSSGGRRARKRASPHLLLPSTRPFVCFYA